MTTAEETHAECVKHMGDPLGEQYSALWQEVAWLNLKWGEYDELFGKKPSRVQLLNNAAPQFFYVVEKVLWEDTLLHIARLTDPPSKGKKSKLTILTLPGLVDASIKSLLPDSLLSQFDGPNSVATGAIDTSRTATLRSRLTVV
jgi:hypothetical protein